MPENGTGSRILSIGQWYSAQVSSLGWTRDAQARTKDRATQINDHARDSSPETDDRLYNTSPWHDRRRRIDRGFLPRVQDRSHAHRRRGGRPGSADPRRVRVLPQRAQLPRRPSLSARSRASRAGAVDITSPASSREPAKRTARAERDPFPIVSERERIAPPMDESQSEDSGMDIEMILRRVIREEAGITAVAPAEKWRAATWCCARQPGPSGEELADRDVLPQDRDGPEPAALARAAGERGGDAGRREGQAAGLHQRMLRLADELQRALRRRRRSVQGRRVSDSDGCS